MELSNLSKWVHTYPNILLCGRISHIPPEPVGEEDEEALMKKLLAKDPLTPRLLRSN